MSIRKVTVSVIIATVDTGGCLLSAVAALVDAAGDVPYEVIIVDNDSVGSGVVLAAESVPHSLVIRNTANEGFAPASNQGARAAAGDFLLFLNDDCVMPPGSLASLIAVAELDVSAAAWQPLIVGRDGRSLDSAGSLFTSTGFLLHQGPPSGRPKAPVSIFAAKGACMLVRRDAFERVGEFRASYFAYFEDADLCWRLRLAGFEVKLIPHIQVRHVGGATTTQLFSASAIDYMSFRNRIRSLLANLEIATLVTVLPAHVLGCALTALAFAATGRKASALAILRAIMASWRDRALIGVQRREVTAIRCREDRDVFAGVHVRMPIMVAAGMLRGYLRRW